MIRRWMVVGVAAVVAQAAGGAAAKFYDLYQVAKEMANSAAGEYTGPQNPDFEHPAEVQEAWANFEKDRGNNMSPQERAQFLPCVPPLNAAIDKAERGYRIQYAQEQAKKNGGKPNEEALAEAAGLHDQAQAQFAECKPAAFQLASQELGPGTKPSEPIPGQAKATVTGNGAAGNALNGDAGQNDGAQSQSGPALDGSVTDASAPDAIDWTPALQPLFKYLGHEWQTHIDPNWAPDEAGNTLTLKLLPGEKPEVVSTTGERASTLNNMMQASGVPAVQFPPGSTLRSVEVSPQFTVKYGIGGGQDRARKKYYERGGKFKVYTAQ